MPDSPPDNFEHYTHCDAAIDDDGMPCTCGAERAKAAWNAGKEASRGGAESVALVYLGVALAQFYEPPEVTAWLESPQRLLGGKTPLELIAEGRLEDVSAVLAALQDGAFV
jgi:hypothetical protein